MHPPHVLSQQKPSATTFDEHSNALVAAVPFGFLAVQVPVVPLVILQ